MSIISIYFGSVKFEGLGTIKDGSVAPNISACASGLGDPITGSSGKVTCKAKTTAKTTTPSATTTATNVVTDAKKACAETLLKGGSCSA